MLEFLKLAGKKAVMCDDLQRMMNKCDEVGLRAPAAFKQTMKEAFWQKRIEEGKLGEAIEALIYDKVQPNELKDKLQGLLLTRVSMCKPAKEPKSEAMKEMIGHAEHMLTEVK